jgi:hypothetical protein
MKLPQAKTPIGNVQRIRANVRRYPDGWGEARAPLDRAARLNGCLHGSIAIGAIAGGAVAGALAKKLKSMHSPLFLIGCALSMLIAGIALQTLRIAMAAYLALSVCGGLLAALSALLQIQIMPNVQLLTPMDLFSIKLATIHMFRFIQRC